jgi:hypothetical protein
MRRGNIAYWMPYCHNDMLLPHVYVLQEEDMPYPANIDHVVVIVLKIIN